MIPNLSMSSLSHSMKVRWSIAARPDRHGFVQPTACQHKAADMLRQMPRQTRPIGAPVRSIVADNETGRIETESPSGSHPTTKSLPLRAMTERTTPPWRLPTIPSPCRPHGWRSFEPIVNNRGRNAGAITTIALIDVTG